MAEKLSRSTLLGKVASYTEVLEKDSKSKAFIPLASTYLQLGMLDDALEVVSRGVLDHPNASTGFTVLGRIQAQRREFGEAVVAFQKAIELDDQNLHALNGLSRLLLLSGDREGASALIERTLSIKPDDPVALKMQGSLRDTPSAADPSTSTRGETAPSSNAVEVDPPAPIATATIAEIYVGQGYPEKALKVYRDLLRANPYNETIRQKLVDLKEQVDRGAGLQKAPVDEDRSEASELTAGQAEMAQGHLQEEGECLRRFFKVLLREPEGESAPF